MIRKNFWSYRDLLNSFGSDQTNRVKVFEYLLYSICILSDEEIIILRNTIEFIEVPYEDYVNCVLNSIKKAHLALPEYLEKPLDVDDYKQIVNHIKKIKRLHKELKKCSFNIYMKLKIKGKLNLLLNKKITVKQVFNYYFLRVAEEENVKKEDLDVFVTKLKEELTSYAKNLPKKFRYLNL